MSKYGVISGPYFPVFGLNTEIYEVSHGQQNVALLVPNQILLQLIYLIYIPVTVPNVPEGLVLQWLVKRLHSLRRISSIFHNGKRRILDPLAWEGIQDLLCKVGWVAVLLFDSDLNLLHFLLIELVYGYWNLPCGCVAASVW